MFSSMKDITINDDIMNLSKGWVVVYKDGSMVTENDMDWGKVRKRDIKVLALKWYNKWWTVRDKVGYLQFKRGSVFVSASGPASDVVTCEERCIGYYDEDGSKVIYRVNDHTGQMALDVQDPK